MDATIMLSTTSLVNNLHRDFPTLAFTASDKFRWSPHENTIFYDHTSNDYASLLHEVAHAVLRHENYARDITLIEMERDAWQYAVTTLAPKYQAAIDDTVVQDSLDTYRDWLHARSICPKCKATGVQTKKSQYRCLICAAQWRVNDARICALRRYTL